MSSKQKISLPDNSPVNPKVLLTISFLEGFLIMVTELISIGLISPHYGQGLTVYTFVLGLTMLSLAVGYFVGARLSKKNNDVRSMALLLLLFNISLLLMPYISKYLFRLTMDLDLVGILLVTIPLFLCLPLLFLGSLSPILIKMLTEDQTIGISSSRIFMFSTLGGVFSALFTSYVLMEFFDVEYVTLVVFILVSFFIGYLSLIRKNKIFMRFSLGACAFCLFFFMATNKKHFQEPLPSSYKVIYKNDGILGQIKIIDNLQEKTRSLYTNNTIQTFSMINGQNVWEYVQKISSFINLSKGKVLLAGLGGGVLVRSIEKQQLSVDIVDIDGRMVDIAQNFYHIESDERINFFVDDIRHYIRSTKKQYHSIVLDLSASENVPSHVFTLEAFTEMKTKLTENGKIIIHYFSDFKPKGRSSIDAIGYTLTKAGFRVKMIPTEKKKNELSSIIYVAFKNDKEPDGQSIKFHLEDNTFKNTIILTDDQPILDVLRKDMVHFTREEYIKGYQSNWETIRNLGLN